MSRPRVIPVLLVRDGALVKTIGFDKPAYIGDPINAVRILNDLRADELVFFDIAATKEKRAISLPFVRAVGEEAHMPFAVGGGIRTLDQVKDVLAAGAEKVVLGSIAADEPRFVADATAAFGSSTVMVCIDVRQVSFGRPSTFTVNGTKRSGYTPEDFALLMEENGAGEIIIQSIDRDGTMSGYDLELVERVARAVTIPVVALGGAGTLAHMKEAHERAHASALAAGSMFVFLGPRRGVLINYPEKSELPF